MAKTPSIPAEARLGFKSRPQINPVTDTVQTTPTKILNNNPERIFWLAVNLSDNKGYVGWDNEVTSSRGIPVPAKGGYASASIEEDGELVIYAVYAVNETLAGTWYIIEIMRR